MNKTIKASISVFLLTLCLFGLVYGGFWHRGFAIMFVGLPLFAAYLATLGSVIYSYIRFRVAYTKMELVSVLALNLSTGGLFIYLERVPCK
jgi:hypothetical protein